MQLGIKSPDSIADAIRLSDQCGKTIAARVLITLKNISGIDQLLANPGILYNANVVYIDKTLPTDLEEYKNDLKQAANSIKAIPPYMLTIENEVFTGEENYNLSMYSDMLETHYRKWIYQNIKVATSGTTMPALGALTNKYLAENVSKEAAANFRSMWGTVYNTRLNDALTEFDLIKSKGLTKLFYNFHYQATSKNIDCLPIVLDALRFYGKIDDKTSLRIGTNELTFCQQSPELVTKAMNYLKDLSFVFVYSDTGNDGKGLPLTPEMETAFLAFA